MATSTADREDNLTVVSDTPTVRASNVSEAIRRKFRKLTTGFAGKKGSGKRKGMAQAVHKALLNVRLAAGLRVGNSHNNSHNKTPPLLTTSGESCKTKKNR